MVDQIDEEYERTLVQLPRVHAFRIPARKSAGIKFYSVFPFILLKRWSILEGYRASDWPKDPIWFVSNI